MDFPVAMEVLGSFDAGTSFFPLAIQISMMSGTSKPAPASTRRNAGSSIAQLMISTLSLFVLYRAVLDIIGPREFGIWSLVVAATSVVGLSNMGLTGSVVKHVADSHAAGDMRRLSGLIDTTVLSVGLLSVLLAVAGYPLMKLYFSATLTGDAYRSATAILPVALVAFCLSMITGIYQSALYGCQLIYQRNGILIFESLSFLGLSISLAPRYGLFGLVYARAVQNILTLMVSIVVLRRNIPQLSLIPRNWTKELFKGLIGYALNFQFISLMSMLMDPLTKGMLSRFGSLEMVTYFEMGTRLIGQARGIVVNANQVLVPTFAMANRGAVSEVQALFLRSYSAIFFVTVCLFGLLAASLPLISLLWLGNAQPIFINFATMLAIGWMLNTLSVPAYFACLGTGTLRIVVSSHLLMSVLNALLGCGLGILLGGYGVVTGWVIALGAGGVAMQIAYCWRGGLGLRNLVPSQGYSLIAFCCAGLLVGRLAMKEYDMLHPAVFSSYSFGRIGLESLLSSGIALLGFGAIFLLPAIYHPARRELFQWLLRRRNA